MGVTFLAPEGVYTSPAKLITKTITENNTYYAADDLANGYSSVTVNVEGGGDFSIVEVELHYTLDGAEFTPDTVEVEFCLPYPENGTSKDEQYFAGLVLTGNDKAYPILYKGEGLCIGVTAFKNDAPYIMAGEPTVTGDMEVGDGEIIINGNGAITFPLAQD